VKLKRIFAIVSTLAILSVGSKPQAATAPRRGPFKTIPGGARIYPKQIDAHVRYDLDPNTEGFFVYFPAAYNGRESYGLIVFTDSQDRALGLPWGWQAVLDSRKYIFIAAQNAGNDQLRNRRLGLAVLGALKLINEYRIDHNRVYAAGFSGGARMAGMLGFYQADVFRGTIQNSGVDFYRRVPIVAATSQLDTAGQPYGVFQASPEEIAGAKKVRFAIITGTNDFRRGNILDIFHGGFERERFQARLFDIPGMGHDVCDGRTLSQVLDFLEQPTRSIN